MTGANESGPRHSGWGSLAARAARHLRWRSERAVTDVVDGLRRGERTVILTPPAGMRFGNWLYLWLDAHQRTAAGRPTVVLAQGGMEPWLEEFPALRSLTITKAAMRFRDRRDRDPRKPNRFGEDFTLETLEAFIAECLAPHIPADSSGTLVINVRRGDYYEGALFRKMFGFDQLGYLREALERAGPAERILVVSDDAAWCREHVDVLARAAAPIVEYMPTDPQANFRVVAGASRIVGTNSTFTYWAAYTAGAVHDRPQIIMPSFHARTVNDGRAVQLDPRWIAIDGHW